jgi:hypothetical protein
MVPKDRETWEDKELDGKMFLKLLNIRTVLERSDHNKKKKDDPFCQWADNSMVKDHT